MSPASYRAAPPRDGEHKATHSRTNQPNRQASITGSPPPRGNMSPVWDHTFCALRNQDAESIVVFATDEFIVASLEVVVVLVLFFLHDDVGS